MASDVTIVRIYLSEADHGRHKNLMQEIMTILHDQHRVRGMTVFRGIAGFSEGSDVQEADLLHIMASLPVTIEFFDEPAVVEAAMKLLQDLVPPNRMVSWQASCR